MKKKISLHSFIIIPANIRQTNNHISRLNCISLVIEKKLLIYPKYQ